eukprot:903486-Prorocentrum_lima.AAC.1
MKSLSGRRGTFTPAEDPDITFVDGRPVENKTKSQYGNPWEHYQECGWKEAFTWKNPQGQQSPWGQ